MKTVLFVTSLLVAGTALAADEVEVRVNRIEMAVAASDEPDGTTGKDQSGPSGTRAQDYNSSRSNTTSLRAQDQRSDRPAGSRGKAQDYNSSRSNNSSRIDTDSDGDSVDDAVCAKGVDDDCDSATDEAPANHNTTRSNRTSP